MGKQFIIRIVLLPIIVSLLTILTIPLLYEENPNAGGMDVELKLIVGFLFMLFLGVYFFVIAFVLPVHYYMTKKVRSKWLTFVVFNVIGGVVIYLTRDVWFFYERGYVSMFLVFPLFAILSWLPVFEVRTGSQLNDISERDVKLFD